MGKKSVLTIRVPEDLKNRLERTAALQGVSLNQLALYAFTKELSELESSEYFRSVLSGMSKDQILSDFDSTLNKVKSRRVPAWDSVS